jgi:hypothetical protein
MYIIHKHENEERKNLGVWERESAKCKVKKEHKSASAK